MKLHLQQGVALQVTGSGPGWLRVNGDTYRASVVLTPETVIEDVVQGGFAALTADDLAALQRHDPEVLLIGTGAAQHFLPPAALRALAEARIGFEVMSTPAACRTYNILAQEGRRVAVALLIDA